MIALYAGTFDPFTNGHLDVVQEAARIFDTLIICVSDNTSKKRHYSAIEMVGAIQDCMDSHTFGRKVKVVRGNMLTTDAAKFYGAEYLIRGLRSTSDYIYEEEIAKFNYMQDPNLRTIYIRAINEISSSTVREMVKYAKNVDQLVPPDVLQVIMKH